MTSRPLFTLRVCSEIGVRSKSGSQRACYLFTRQMRTMQYVACSVELVAPVC